MVGDKHLLLLAMHISADPQIPPPPPSRLLLYYPQPSSRSVLNKYILLCKLDVLCLTVYSINYVKLDRTDYCTEKKNSVYSISYIRKLDKTCVTSIISSFDPTIKA